MKRLVWGIIMAVFGALGLLSAGITSDASALSVILDILCMAYGCAMIYFGTQYLRHEGNEDE